jgi:acetyltransferase
MVVIFGTPGLFPVFDVYRLLDERMKSCKKPVFPVLPSGITAKDEISEFIGRGRIIFPDEVVLGNALARVFHTPAPQAENIEQPAVDLKTIRGIVNNAKDGYLEPADIRGLLDAASIPRAGEAVVTSTEAAVKAAGELGFPLVMKVVGPVHKSDVGGVVLNVKDVGTVEKEYTRMIKIPETTAILMQPMLSGIELFAGASRDEKFGHMIMCGMGGIFIEVLKDVSAGLVPIGAEEAGMMISKLKSFKILEGVRGQQGADPIRFAEVITRLSALLQAAPEIAEMDLNPLLGKGEKVIAVDARIRIEK